MDRAMKSNLVGNVVENAATGRVGLSRNLSYGFSAIR